MADVFFVGDTGEATVDWVDAAGNEDTQAVASDAWSSDNPQVATVTADATDSTKPATITCVSAGTCNISVQGTNRADGVKTSIASFPFTVNGLDAAAGTISVTKKTPAPAVLHDDTGALVNADGFLIDGNGQVITDGAGAPQKGTFSVPPVPAETPADTGPATDTSVPGVGDKVRNVQTGDRFTVAGADAGSVTLTDANGDSSTVTLAEWRDNFESV